MIDLRTRYLGLQLKSPLVVSANPLSEKIDNILKMEDAGAGAVVLFSLFEEQLKQEASRLNSVLNATSNSFAEAADFFTNLDEYSVNSDQYLALIQEAKKRTDIPIIASLNGITPEGWTQFALEMERAGADALEVNVFFIPGDTRLTASDVENRYVDIIKSIKSHINIPIAVKMNPYFSSLGFTANNFFKAGADGLVLFNRFYQPDYDIENFKIIPNLDFSHPSEIRLPLLWIALLYDKNPWSLAATTGVYGARELIKYVLAGAQVAMVASCLYRHGIPWIREILDDLKLYMNDMGFDTPDAFRGIMSQKNIPNPIEYERSNYIKILENQKLKV